LTGCFFFVPGALDICKGAISYHFDMVTLLLPFIKIDQAKR